MNEPQTRSVAVTAVLPLKTRSGKTLSVVRAEFGLQVPDGLREPLDVKVGRRSYRVTLELPREALDCERVEYQHKGIPLEPDGVEEIEIVRDADGRPVGMRKEVYPWG